MEKSYLFERLKEKERDFLINYLEINNIGLRTLDNLKGLRSLINSINTDIENTKALITIETKRNVRIGANRIARLRIIEKIDGLSVEESKEPLSKHRDNIKAFSLLSKKVLPTVKERSFLLGEIGNNNDTDEILEPTDNNDAKLKGIHEDYIEFVIQVSKEVDKNFSEALKKPYQKDIGGIISDFYADNILKKNNESKRQRGEKVKFVKSRFFEYVAYYNENLGKGIYTAEKLEHSNS